MTQIPNLLVSSKPDQRPNGPSEATQKRRAVPQLLTPFLLAAGLAAWIVGISTATPQKMPMAGLLLGPSHWIPIGFALVFMAIAGELVRAKPRNAVLFAALVVFLVMVYAAVPIVFGAPEYAWVYKHVGVISEFQRYGQAVNAWDIYNEWPTFFAGVAEIASLAHVNVITFAAWAPLFFELANALMVFALLRLMTDNDRTVWLALALYVGFVAWIGQDYLSPQAFAYLLWLGVAWMMLRWLRGPGPRWLREPRPRWLRASGPRWLRARGPRWLRTSRLQAAAAVAGAGSPAAAVDSNDQPDQRFAVTPRVRLAAILLISLLYVAIATSHQLTPYIGLLGVGALVVFGFVRPRWILLVLVLITGGYLALHWHLIESEYIGDFGGDPIANASGVSASNFQQSTAAIWTERASTLAMYGMWFGAIVLVIPRLVIPRLRDSRYLIAGLLAFSPILIALASSYGGEAIYRAFIFSAPWSAFLIADAVVEWFGWAMRPALVLGLALVLTAGVQGLFGRAYVYGFTSADVAASQWLYGHMPRHSLVVLPDGDFPVDESADYGQYTTQIMPADPTLGAAWMNEADSVQVKRWLTRMNRSVAYIVTSKSMERGTLYDGAPLGYNTLARRLEQGFLNARLIFENSSTKIYRIRIG